MNLYEFRRKNSWIRSLHQRERIFGRNEMDMYKVACKKLLAAHCSSSSYKRTEGMAKLQPKQNISKNGYAPNKNSKHLNKMRKQPIMYKAWMRKTR